MNAVTKRLRDARDKWDTDMQAKRARIKILYVEIASLKKEFEEIKDWTVATDAEFRSLDPHAIGLAFQEIIIVEETGQAWMWFPHTRSAPGDKVFHPSSCEHGQFVLAATRVTSDATSLAAPKVEREA